MGLSGGKNLGRGIEFKRRKNYPIKMAARPMVTVFGDQGEATEQMALPTVFCAPIRHDVVNFVHTNVAKNKRQPYAVSRLAGHQTSAESWGTSCRCTYSPCSWRRYPQIWSGSFRKYVPRWTYVCPNQNQRRYATVSGIAATALPALVMARGHKIENIPEVPLVVSGMESLTKTKAAVALLKRLSAYDDVQKCIDSKKIRAGKGKLRNRRHRMRRGPPVIYNEDHGIRQAFRNIPGVE